ncbi:TPA: helix-turn-helix domain-containing protein [Streptococcus suis]|uniref:Transcriptional regulator n=1 Tax=Streptococcus suis TaxID=1307 RepID=A0A3R8SZ81_STRSU|nr:helix-turn-helix transcriptional regulator [Streptococcus suis]MDW8742775.1 helix-turn-helix transcriptional regulator [Streptococcus suis]NJW38821.1 helix-turn-helix transcriptional regulator [Streptococcus suis]NQG18615.1 helix-turn-helix transcriptional regulator [Streptococcus suis]NQH32674.1 helix-turn-helix transcriptional regulator [Streptococcus suis]NQH95553.1 helix-turn-helix transcriptional regulator [Streptococcus suis]
MIQINLDIIMAQKRISAGRLAELIELTPANLSILKNNKAKAIRFSTLNALCRELGCQPGDILEYVPDEEDEHEG